MDRLNLGLYLLCLPLLFCSGCNGGKPAPTPDPPVMNDIVVPVGYMGGESALFTASWTGGTAPFTISWDFGGGAIPNTAGPLTATSPDHRHVELANHAGGNFTVSATLTDANGEIASSSASYTYGPGASHGLIILSIVSGDNTDTITVSSSIFEGGEEDVVVSAAPPSGIQVVESEQLVPGGFGEVTFHFTADDLFAGGNGTVDFGADYVDGPGADSMTSANVVVAGLTLAADTLYAVPLKETAALGEPVTIVVATGVPASTFQFLNGCRVSAPEGFHYEDGSFNIGAPGGGQYDVDGYWTGMNPGGGFMQPFDGTDFTINESLSPAGAGRVSYDFSVLPMGGSDRTTDDGALFNFGATFAAGVDQLGFVQAEGVNRTYYTDSNAAPDRFWGDITNDHPGVPNTVTVSTVPGTIHHP